MDREIKDDKVSYHLSGEEVDYLRSLGYGPLVMPRTTGTRAGRTLAIQNNTPSGKQSQRHLERVITDGGFEIKNYQSRNLNK